MKPKAGRLHLVLSALLLGLYAEHSLAEGVQWPDLSPDEQRVLGSAAEKWDGMTAEKQLKLQKGAQRWLNMDSDQKTKARRNLKRWKELSADRRARIRQHYQRFRKLPPDQKQKRRAARALRNRQVLFMLLARISHQTDPVN